MKFMMKPMIKTIAFATSFGVAVLLPASARAQSAIPQSCVDGALPGGAGDRPRRLLPVGASTRDAGRPPVGHDRLTRGGRRIRALPRL